MIKEVYDKNSGAILFKKDEESLAIDKLIAKVKILEEDITILNNKINILENLINSK